MFKIKPTLPALKAKQFPLSVNTGVNQDELQVIPDHVHCNADVNEGSQLQ